MKFSLKIKLFNIQYKQIQNICQKNVEYRQMPEPCNFTGIMQYEEGSETQLPLVKTKLEKIK